MADDKRDQKPEITSKRVRSPAYPAIGLPKAIEYASAFYAQEHKHAAAPAVAARALGFSDEKSGPASSALSALKKFGLLLGDEKGHVQLSPWALDIVLSPHPQHEHRQAAIRSAALAPAIYRELWEKWQGHLPSDKNIEYYLERERNFNPKAIRDFIRDFRATLEFAGLIGDGQSREIPIPDEGEQCASSENPDELDPANEQARSSRRRPMQAGMKEAVLPLDEGDVVINFPEQISADSYEDVEAWVRILLRRMKRSVPKEGSVESGEE